MDFSFCLPLQELISSRRTVGQSGKVFEGLSALTTVNNLRVLRALMMESKPTNTLEVGLSFGGSALTIAATHRDLGHAAGRQHVAIDPYQRSVWDNSGLLGLDRAGLREYVEFHEQLSAFTLASLAAQGRTFDLIYIDGSHRFDDVFVDAYYSLRLLASRGVVMFDDCSTREVGTVLRFIERNLGGWVTELDLSSYRDGDASWRYQLARLLGKVQLRAFRRIGDEPSWDARLRGF